MSNEVPHLKTALTGPLLEIEKNFLSRQTEIETWFRNQWKTIDAPLTCSVDLRNAGYKLAPVDTNLFPAGFNNLNRDFLPLCIQSMQMTLSMEHANCQRILILAESHTRNINYFESLGRLYEIICKSGYEIRISSLHEELTEPTTVSLKEGRELVIEPLQRKDDKLFVSDFTPCLILLNNDLSQEIPEILVGISQAVEVPLELSWSQRKKSSHFTYYQSIAEEFSTLINIDPWFINPLFRVCGKVDFMAHEGEDCLANHIDFLLNAIQEKYDQYGIKQKPFVFVKADAGTYGMGVISVSSSEEIRTLNRKQRKKMSASKGSMKVTQVILQEGVPTFESAGVDLSAAEPVVYMIGRHVIGGFYRVHKSKSDTDSLNAPGMEFEPLAFEECCSAPDTERPSNEAVNRFYAYGVIARLALLAAARERQEVLR